MKPFFGAALSYYGQASFDYASLRFDLEMAKIPISMIRGCPYPEMTRAEQFREFLETDLEVLAIVDGNVSTCLEDVEALAEAAKMTKGIVLGHDGSWSRALEFCAIHRTVVETVATREDRTYGNSAVEMTFNAERKMARPLASPWNRDGSPLVAGDWLTPCEAFLMRAQRAMGSLVIRMPRSKSTIARRTIRTSIVNGDEPITEEPGSKFALCIPSFGALDVDQNHAVDKLAKAGMVVIRVHDCPWIDQSRSWLSEKALELGRGVFFLDHDIVFEPNDVLRLCEQGLEKNTVVSAAYCMRKSGANIIGAFDVPPGPITFFEGGSTLPAHYSGLGFSAIPAGVLEGIELPKLHSAESRRLLRPWFALDCSTGFYAGEDVSFCKRVHDLTIRTVERDGPGGSQVEWVPAHSGRPCRIFIDTRVRIMHRGSYDYGIEDAGIVVPRTATVEATMTESRAEAKALLVDASKLPVDLRLDAIDGYAKQAENLGFEAI